MGRQLHEKTLEDRRGAGKEVFALQTHLAESSQANALHFNIDMNECSVCDKGKQMFEVVRW